MKILSRQQIRTLDQITVDEENIASIELMERAAITFVDWFMKQYPPSNRPIQIICGTGNNGGDGLAVGRLLKYLKYTVEIYVIPLGANTSPDFNINLEQIKQLNIPIFDIEETEAIPDFKFNGILVDAILGSGLNRPVDGFVSEVIEQINAQCDTIIAMDIASGLFADEHTSTASITPNYTFSFEFPKLAFFFSENYKYVGNWAIETIALSPKGIASLETSNYYITPEMISQIYKKRTKFSHKGTYGHSLLIAGSYGMMGAAILTTKACLRSGTGLVTVHIPETGYEIIQTAVPEAIVSIDKDKYAFTNREIGAPYDAVGIGCGLGQNKKTFQGLNDLLNNCDLPLVIDADALNIIAANKWQKIIPNGSIITPHVKEFVRLFGESKNDFERNKLQRKRSKKLGIYIVLKGAHTTITTPDGLCYFNSTGNPGMATAGSGDVLTGMITGLLSQGYSRKHAAILGTYIHGLAGDCAAEQEGEYAMMANDIIKNIGKAFVL